MHNDSFSNYLVESTSNYFNRYGKMYGDVEVTNEDTELIENLVDYLITEGYAEDVDHALDILEELDDDDFEQLLEYAPGYASREYAVRRQKDIEHTSGRLKSGAIKNPAQRQQAISDLQAQRRQRSVSGDKYSGKAAEVRKQARTAKAARMASERREKEAAQKPKGLMSRAKSAIKKALRREDFQFNESLDVYDIVFSYLLDEGHAVSYSEALNMMHSLNEEEIEYILEVRGMGGHVDPVSKKYSGERSSIQDTNRYDVGNRHRDVHDPMHGYTRNTGSYAISTKNRSRTVKSGESNSRESSPSYRADYTGRKKPEAGDDSHMRHSPLDKAIDKADRFERQGKQSRADKIRNRFVKPTLRSQHAKDTAYLDGARDEAKRRRQKD